MISNYLKCSTLNSLKVVFVVLMATCTINGQNILEEDLVGTWTAKVKESRSPGTKMAFDGSTFSINADHTFSAKVMAGIEGSWKIEDERLILESSDFPSPIVLSELSPDSCFWDLKEMEAKIKFYKNYSETLLSPLSDSDVVDVKREDLIGRWENILVEDINMNQDENSFLFGSVNDDQLNLMESGKFTLTESSYNTLTGRILKGVWSIDKGIIHFKSDSGYSEQLGITAFDSDQLVLEFLHIKDIPMCGKTRIRYTHSRNKK